MGVDWRNKENLKDLSWGEALVILGSITESLQQRNATSETTDSADLHTMALSASPEAQAFADAANAWGRRMRAAGDCRPELRIRSEERKVLDAKPVTAEEDAASYADSLRPYHRR
jgi:hypothetical protein